MFMELRSDTSILRSNTPALSGSGENSKGILQASSGNVGSSNYESAFGVSKGTFYDYEANVLPPSEIPRCHSAQNTLKLQRRKQRREDDEEVDSLKNYPIQIITQAERLSPRYQAYRNKQRTTFMKGSNTEQKWPDELEEVFQQGECRESLAFVSVC